MLHRLTILVRAGFVLLLSGWIPSFAAARSLSLHRLEVGPVRPAVDPLVVESEAVEVLLIGPVATRTVTQTSTGGLVLRRLVLILRGRAEDP